MERKGPTGLDGASYVKPKQWVVWGSNTWNFLTTLLEGHIFKAKYYPRSSIFEANKSSSPSLIWCGLYDNLKWFQDSFEWKLGNEEHVFL